jgi:hypothetical protein
LKLINIYDANLTSTYKLYCLVHKQNIYRAPYFISFFSIYIHKKLHYYNFFYNNKYYNYSNGQLLKVRTKLTKFFKKSRKSYGASITALNKKLNKHLCKINFFFCKNFNYKNYLWFKKLYDLIDPQINCIMTTQGWTYVHKYRRRIKKKILRNLIKSSFIV